MHDLNTIQRLNEEAGKTPEEVQAIRGRILAENLGLKRDQEHADRWDLPGVGNKTDLELARYIIAWADKARV